MYSACVQEFTQWRDVARPLLSAGIAPEEMAWSNHGHFQPLASPIAATAPLRLSRQLIELLETISCYRHDGRWDLMYRLAWRSLRQPRLLEDAADPDVHRAIQMASAVHRDIHKMHAFVRFREMIDEQGERKYFAWFEPTHEILRQGVPFF